MCGIFGYSLHDTDVENIFYESLKHRGPDSRDSIYVDDWTLGHLRLAILDTSTTGMQPMSYKGSWIVFNGEIYNFLELRNKYLRNTKLRGGSDTEILLRLLVKFGTQILNELNGMFSFAFYNSVSKELFLCRDRFGVKPLYWSKINDKFYFSSETKPLAKLQVEPKLNPDIIKSYLDETVTDHLKESFISEIYQIEPGHFACIKGNTIKQRKWYKRNDYKFDKNVFTSKKSTLEHFEDLLTDALRLRYRSDVPVCLTLSGGLDSSVLYVLSKERLQEKIYPIAFQNQGSAIDEIPAVVELTKKYSDRVSIVRNKANYSVDDILTTCKILEFPIWNPSAVAYKAIYEAINKQGYKVVIEGHGSDEQLGGYPYMIEEIWKEHVQEGKFLSAYYAYKAYQSALNKNLDQKTIPGLFILQCIKVLLEKVMHTYNGKQVIFKSFDRNILPMVLRAFDRLSMSESLESRCPFMDYRLVEFIRAMPVDYLVDELGSKAPLRHILKKYNNAFVFENKPKVGFAIDIKQFFSQYKVKKLIETYINKFDFENFLEHKRRAIELMSSPTQSWQSATEIWKVAGLAITKSLYDSK